MFLLVDKFKKVGDKQYHIEKPLRDFSERFKLPPLMTLAGHNVNLHLPLAEAGGDVALLV